MVAASPMEMVILQGVYISLVAFIILVVFTEAIATTMVAIPIIATTAYTVPGQLPRHAGRVVSEAITITPAVDALHVTAAQPVTFNICPKSTAISVSHIHRKYQIHGKNPQQYR